MDCDTGLVVVNPGEFPGNSDLRWEASQLSWKFNLQTVLTNGAPFPANNGGTDYCLQVVSELTGQTVPDSGFTIIRVRP